MYGKSLEIKPMKAWKLPKGKEGERKRICENGDYFGQIKKDGFHYMFEKDIDGKCFLWARDNSVKTGHLTEKVSHIPHLVEAFQDIPNGTILVGEIYRPKMTSKDVGKIMNCSVDKALDRQKELGFVHYYLFDILRYKGQMLLTRTNLDRVNVLAHILKRHDILKYECVEFSTPYFDNLDKMIDDVMEAGEEGMVLKAKDSLYHPDKKPSWNWIKFKIEDDADVICMGSEPPKKEYTGTTPLDQWKLWEDTVTGNIDNFYGEAEEWNALEGEPNRYVPVSKPYARGWIGSLIIGVMRDGELVRVGKVSSGLTDEICEEIKQDPYQMVDRLLAVGFMQAYEGALRHPTFVRWRDDLNVSDCTWEKIFE